MTRQQKVQRLKSEFVEFYANFEEDFDKSVEKLDLEPLKEEDIHVYAIALIGELITNSAMCYQLLLRRAKDESKDAIHGEQENGRTGAQDSGGDSPTPSH